MAATIRPPAKRQTTNKIARRKTPKEGAKRTLADIAAEDKGPPLTGIEKREDVKATLANQVNQQIREAVQARESGGIDDDWNEAEDLYQGIDDLTLRRGGMNIPDKRPAPARSEIDPAQSTLYINIVKPKTKLAISRVKEMLVPNNDRPWSIGPTPIPDFDEVTTDPALAGQNVQLGDGSLAPALAVVEMARTRAAKIAESEADWIEDKFVEGKVYRELRKVIDSAGRLGTGVLKGPFAVCRKKRSWTVDRTTTPPTATLQITEKIDPTSKSVRVQDCFPDPACGDSIHNGSYFVERSFLSSRALRKLADDPGYDRLAIAQALLEGPISEAMLRSSDTRMRRKPGDTVKESALFELWHWYGDVSAESLIAMGVDDPALSGVDRTYGADGADAADEPEELGDTLDSDDPEQALNADQKAALTQMPGVVTMLNGRPIKAVISPLESGEFPFDFFPWEEVDGQPWGRGIPLSMRAAQLIVKQGVRRMLENGGMSSGPQIVITDKAIEPMNNRPEIVGRKLWKFIPNDLVNDVQKAFAVINIPSMQEELLKIIQFGLEMADQTTNVPMLLQGDQQAGTSPETLGGMKLLVNNALSPLRDIAKGNDDNLMIPHLNRWHEWWMAHGDSTEKGDTDIKALGSTALVQREEGREFLMLLGPVKDDPAYRINPQKYADELARANGYDMTLIQFTEDEWKVELKKKAQQPPPEVPVVQAAKIRAQAQGQTDQIRIKDAEAERAFKAQQNEADRQAEAAIAAVQKDIETMRLSGQENISIESIKAMLATKAADIRSRRDEMQLKMAPANRSGQGI